MSLRPSGIVYVSWLTFTAQKRQRPADNNAQGKPRSTVTVYAYHLTVLKVKILNFCQVPLKVTQTKAGVTAIILSLAKPAPIFRGKRADTIKRLAGLAITTVAF